VGVQQFSLFIGDVRHAWPNSGAMHVGLMRFCTSTIARSKEIAKCMQPARYRGDVAVHVWGLDGFFLGGSRTGLHARWAPHVAVSSFSSYAVCTTMVGTAPMGTLQRWTHLLSSAIGRLGLAGRGGGHATGGVEPARLAC
jgi:hypothetical protein